MTSKPRIAVIRIFFICIVSRATYARSAVLQQRNHHYKYAGAEGTQPVPPARTIRAVPKQPALPVPRRVPIPCRCSLFAAYFAAIIVRHAAVMPDGALSLHYGRHATPPV